MTFYNLHHFNEWSNQMSHFEAFLCNGYSVVIKWWDWNTIVTYVYIHEYMHDIIYCYIFSLHLTHHSPVLYVILLNFKIIVIRSVWINIISILETIQFFTRYQNTPLLDVAQVDKTYLLSNNIPVYFSV